VKKVVANPVARFEELAPGRRLISTSVDWFGNPVLLFADETELAAKAMGAEDENDFSPPFRKRDVVFRLVEGAWRRRNFEHDRRNFFFAQPLPNEWWLLVESTTYEQTEQNACVYSTDGVQVRSFALGDAVENLQTTEDGKIWVGYFDEGVFSDPLSSVGAACFDSQGMRLFDYRKLADSENLPAVDDCYAMNVESGESVWLCYYSDFPLVHLSGFQLNRIWRNVPVGGAKAFGLGKNGNVILAGGYVKADVDALAESTDLNGIVRSVAEGQGLLYLLNLDFMRFTQMVAVDSQGQPIAFRRAAGRGSYLYLETPDALFMVNCLEVSY